MNVKVMLKLGLKMLKLGITSIYCKIFFAKIMPVF